MSKRIAIIGWGSLIWDLEILKPHTVGDWEMTKGPVLPMEFSRISPKRKMGLVVCLDPVTGVDCMTHIIQSSRVDIIDSLNDLAARERAPQSLIGWTDTERGAGRMPDVVSKVRHWCVDNGWDGAVWTDLEPNFAGHTGSVFAISAGLEYLKTLAGDSLREAYNYIENAPIHTKTPLRDMLEADLWWQGLKKDQQR